jgi:glycosyltransferase involved in cell wall biosynthesis
VKIAIYWEQFSWGGVDSQLLALLNSWPVKDDHFILHYNKGNPGLTRIKTDIEKLHHVSLNEIASLSSNAVYDGMSHFPVLRKLCKVLKLFQPVFVVLMTFKLIRVFRRDSYDVLLSNNGGYPGAWGCLSAIFAAKLADIPVRALLVHHEANKPSNFMGWFENVVDVLVMKSSSVIVCPSYATRKSLIDRRHINVDLVRMRVIYNEIVANTDNNSSEVCDIRGLTNANNKLLIGIMGRVEAYKGHEDIIYAISRLSDEDKNKIKLVVIGKGNGAEIERLQRIADRLNVGESLCFFGYLQGSSAAIIKQLDLLVVATRSFEGFGLTLAEAILEDVPVLATSVGAIPEFIDDSVGRLVSVGAPKEMALAISDFINNKKKWNDKSEKAKQRIHNISHKMSNEYRRLFIECNDSPKI